MKPQIYRFAGLQEFFIPEGCHIVELSNSDSDPDVSIARARVEPGVTTAWHSLTDTVERYVILEGCGCVEIGDLDPEPVEPGDTIIIPPGCRQRVTCTSQSDLVFIAVCSPRFRSTTYQDLS